MTGRTFAAAITGSLLGLIAPAGAHASCIPQSEQQQTRQADMIFVGVASEGPTESGMQRFEVERYLKGAGPSVVGVATGVVAGPDGTGSVTSVSVVAAAGERWRIYATKRGDATLETSVCAGSVELAPASEKPTGPPPGEAAGNTASKVAARAALPAGLVAAAALAAVAILRRKRSA